MCVCVCAAIQLSRKLTILCYSYAVVVVVFCIRPHKAFDFEIISFAGIFSQIKHKTTTTNSFHMNFLRNSIGFFGLYQLFGRIQSDCVKILVNRSVYLCLFGKLQTTEPKKNLMEKQISVWQRNRQKPSYTKQTKYT